MNSSRGASKERPETSDNIPYTVTVSPQKNKQLEQQSSKAKYHYKIDTSHIQRGASICSNGASEETLSTVRQSFFEALNKSDESFYRSDSNNNNNNNIRTMEDDNNEANKHKMSDWLRRWLFWLKKYYLFAHYGYIILIALCTSLICFLTEDVTYLDALFEAVSCVSNTGISTVSVSNWGRHSSVARHIAMVLGGMVFASAWTPMIRLVMLRRLKEETKIDDFDDASLKAWKKKKKMFIERLETTSIITAGLTYIYFFFYQLIGFIALAINMRHSADVTTYDILCWVIGPFQNYGINIRYLPSDVTCAVIVALLVGGGGSLFPVFLRYLCHAMRRSILVRRWLYKRWINVKNSNVIDAFQRSDVEHSLMPRDSNNSNYGGVGVEDVSDDGSDFNPGKNGITTIGGERLRVRECSVEDEVVGGVVPKGDHVIDGHRGTVISNINNPKVSRRFSTISRSSRMTISSNLRRRANTLLLDGPVAHRTVGDLAAIPHLVYYDNYWDSDRYKRRSRWEKGINTILHTQNPSIFHPLLFNWEDTHYLLLAFLFITGFQMIPFLDQQWNALLAPWGSGVNKVLIAFSQSVYVRFSGIAIVNINLLSNIHICWMIFAMYIPVIPIPNLDRSRLRWKQMVKAGIMRLLTSRIFLLFISMSVIVWIEEDRLYASVQNTHFDVATRTLFDVISCYATSGMSIPTPNNHGRAFSSNYHPVSKMILILVMIIGRHRWMEMGLDVGLNELEQSEREVEALLLGKSIPSSEREAPESPMIRV